MYELFLTINYSLWLILAIGSTFKATLTNFLKYQKYLDSKENKRFSTLAGIEPGTFWSSRPPYKHGRSYFFGLRFGYKAKSEIQLWLCSWSQSLLANISFVTSYLQSWTKPKLGPNFGQNFCQTLVNFVFKTEVERILYR